MPRDRIVVVGLLAVAGAGFVADRTIFRSDAGAAETPVAGAETSLVSAGMGKVQSAVAGMIRDQFREAFDAQISQQAGSLDFGPASEWMARPTLATATLPGESRPARPSSAPPTSGLPSLTVVMPTQSGGVAVIDGVRLTIGQSHPTGFKLIAVGDRTATIVRDGRTIELSMSVSR